jgi:hypothetical protein
VGCNRELFQCLIYLAVLRSKTKYDRKQKNVIARFSYSWLLQQSEEGQGGAESEIVHYCRGIRMRSSVMIKRERYQPINIPTVEAQVFFITHKENEP